MPAFYETTSKTISSQTNNGYVVYETGASPEFSNVLTVKNTSFINNTVENTFENPNGRDYLNYLQDIGDYNTIDKLWDLIDEEAKKLGYDIENGEYPPQDIEEELATKIVTNTPGYKDLVNSLRANGGAIYSKENTKISADGGNVIFKNNKVITNGHESLNDIYIVTHVVYSHEGDSSPKMANSPTELVTLNLDARNGGTISLDGTIDGEVQVRYQQQAYDMQEPEYQEYPEFVKPESAYNLAITGDGTGKVIFGNSVHNASILTYDGSMSILSKDSNWDNNILTLNGGTISMVNNTVGVSNLNRMLVVKDSNLIADVDLANKTMDRFTANEYGEHFGKLNVSGMNLISDTKTPRVAILFAEKGLKDNVTATVKDLPDNVNQLTAYTPIYKYKISYDNRDDAGYFVFDRRGGSSPSDAYNPSVLSAPVSSVAAAQASINETFKYVFEHADAFTQLPSIERMARINTNQYALSTDYNQNLGSLATEFNNQAGWFRPYVTFESMNLKNGPKVNATTYGSLVGFDSNFQKLGKGWTGLTTGYLGYNGSQLSYSGVDTTMNGGILGLTQTFYKGNFWTALTASAGASVGQSKTMYGDEDFTSLMAGVGSKTGYNFEFKEGKYILQPIMFLSYTFVNTFDYTNAAGVKINADPAHSIQLNPSIRFITNTKNGWQPYASVGMVWNVMNANKVMANNVRLPEMSMKPYIEYGIGLQKRFKDKFTAFGQAMVRNGGRNGIALTAGFRWNLGKEGKPIEKVEATPSQNVKAIATASLREAVGNMSPDSSKLQTNSPMESVGVSQPKSANKLRLLSQTDILARANNTLKTPTERKIVKQLSSSQKITYGSKPQNTTRTTYRATLKQL